MKRDPTQGILNLTRDTVLPVVAVSKDEKRLFKWLQEARHYNSMAELVRQVLHAEAEKEKAKGSKAA